MRGPTNIIRIICCFKIVELIAFKCHLGLYSSATFADSPNNSESAIRGMLTIK